MGRPRRDRMDANPAVETGVRRELVPRSTASAPTAETVAEPPAPQKRVFLGKAVQRGYGGRPRLSLDAAASFATLVDTARARAAMEGRTLVYTVRWG